MTTIQPKKSDYNTHDGFELARNIAWVIKTLWAGAVFVVLASLWVAALAADVKSNAEKIEQAATQEQMAQVLEGIKDIKQSLTDADARQRDIKSQVDKLEAQVEDIKKRDE